MACTATSCVRRWDGIRARLRQVSAGIPEQQEFEGTLAQGPPRMVSRRETRAAKPNEYLETTGSKSTRLQTRALLAVI
jgi:hypothetical protein